jgi:hypothetical protein
MDGGILVRNQRNPWLFVWCFGVVRRWFNGFSVSLSIVLYWFSIASYL